MKNERDIDSYEKTFTERPKETYSLETDYLVTHSEIEKKKILRDNFVKSNSSQNELKDPRDKKIMDQAKRLCELQEYIILCEKKLKNLVPSKDFPQVDKNFKKSFLNEETYYKEIENLNQIIQLKEEEIDRLKGKSGLLKQSFNSSFSSQDKIPNEKLREAYNRLYKSYNILIKEKEEIMNNLRAETLLNEEQRNYIEILKKTIESKSGKIHISNQVNNIKPIPFGSHAFNDEMLQDIARLQTEVEKYKNELINLRNSFQEINVTLENSNKNNEILKKENENLIKEIDELKCHYNSNKDDKSIYEISKMARELELVKEEKISMQNNIEMLSKVNNKLENDLKELFKKNCQNEIKISDLIQFQNKYHEIKSLNEKLREDLDKLSKEKDYLEIERTCYKQKTDEKQFLIEKIDIDVKEQTERLERDKREIEKNNHLLIKHNSNLEKKVCSLNNEMLEINEEYNDMKMKCENLINLNEELTNKNEKLSNGIEEIQTNFSSKFDYMEQTLIELEKINRNLVKNNNEIAEENKNLYNDLKELKEELLIKENEKNKVDKNNLQMEKNFSILMEKYNRIKSNFELLEQDYQSKIKEKEKVLKENKILKERLEETMKNKNDEINEACENIDKSKNEIDKLKEQLSEKSKILNQLKDENATLQDHVISLESHVKQLQFKDLENKGISEKLNILILKLEETTREKEEYMNESLNRIKQINEVNFKYEKILKEKITAEENLKEMEFNINKLNDNNRKLQSETKCLSSEINELKKKNENQEILLVSLKEKKLNAETMNDTLQNKYNELRDLYNETLESKNKSEASLIKVSEEAEKSRKSEKEYFSNIIQLQNELNEIKLNLTSCTSVSRISLQKLRVALNQEEKTKVYSDQFISFYSKFYNYLIKPINEIQTVKFLEEWTKISSFELDSLYTILYRLKEDDNRNKEKNSFLEERVNDNEKKNEEINEINKNLSLKYQEIKIENNTLIEELENYRKKYDNLQQEYRKLDNEHKKLNLETDSLRKEIENLYKFKTEMDGELAEKNILEEKYKTLKHSLDLKTFTYEKEKTLIVTLTQKIAKAFPKKEIIKLVNNFLKNSEEIIELEKEKMKIEGKFKKIDQEMIHLDNDETAKIRNKFKNDVDNLKEKLKDLEESINGKKEIQYTIENQIEVIEAEERRQRDCIYEYEIKIRQLESQLNDTLSNINIVKQSRNDFNVNKITTQSYHNDNIKGNTYCSERENSLQNKSIYSLKIRIRGKKSFQIKNIE